MWNIIILEGFCYGNKEDVCPCGRTTPTSFCLTAGGCPYFSYSEATDTDASSAFSLWKFIVAKVRFFLSKMQKQPSISHIQKSNPNQMESFTEWLRKAKDIY